MTPPSAPATERRLASSEPVRRRHLGGADERPRLEVVGPLPRHRRIRRRRTAPIVAAALVVGSLMAVVAGHSVLAEDQVRLSNVESALSSAQATEREDTLQAAEGENPSRIVSEARRLGMVTPNGIVQLPHVPLGTPLPVPSLATASSGGGRP